VCMVKFSTEGSLHACAKVNVSSVLRPRGKRTPMSPGYEASALLSYS